MISVEQALKIIDSKTSQLLKHKIQLQDTLDFVLAESILSPINMPPFRQSAMDGYALNYDESISDYKLIGEVAAGSGETFNLKPGEAVRIFTGAAVPDSANVVAQQEIVNRIENKFTLTKEVQVGLNIRLVGEQIKVGITALEKGIILNPAAIGFLATLGITEVEVFSKPKIGLLTTGNELIKPGTPLSHGQIYESNSVMLETAITQHHHTKPELVKVKDDLATTQNALADLIQKNDVILISGGISVGDYDFVKTALENLGVKEEFYKIKQKPGKPIYFGTLNQKLIFALPGNPASALTCFYIYVLPALNKSAGKKFEGLKIVKRKLKNTYQKKSGLAHFLKSVSDDEFVEISDSQSSAMLNTFAVANGLIFLPEEIELVDAGNLVDVFLF
ncbi:MAG: molybdopterin molybdotransferase MoeA [Crocinitomicaceae bacterium]|nr:molybdopterin molybdotransferase MoeA [Crocinitomicaceae bacterium]